MSWVEKENPALKHARPRELVDRGLGEQVIELLNKRERDRIKEDKRRDEKETNNKKWNQIHTVPE